MRTALAIIVAYVGMTIFMFVFFTGLYFAFGADKTFLPGSFQVTSAWLVGSFIIGFIGTMIGGFIAVSVAKKRKTAVWFGAVVLVLTLVFAVLAMTQTNSNLERTGSTPNLEAMQKAQQPLWFNFLIPFTGFVGAVLGGRMRKGDEIV